MQPFSYERRALREERPSLGKSGAMAWGACLRKRKGKGDIGVKAGIIEFD